MVTDLTSQPNGALTSAGKFFTLLAQKIDDKDLDGALEVIRTAMSAEKSVRVALNSYFAGTSGRNYKYETVPDWKTRLVAVQVLLRFKCLPPPSLREVRILHGSTGEQRREPTAAEVLSQMKRAGADVDGVLDSWVEQMRPADVAAPPAAPNGAQPLELEVADS